ncbi:MAG: hypothetical protein ACI9A2_004667 [Halioglobus sp.]|jgi:hypothetical protein
MTFAAQNKPKQQETKMLRALLSKTARFGIFLTSLSLFCAQTQGAIIASFDTGVDVDITSSFAGNELYTELCCSEEFTIGSASTSSASGTGSSGGDTEFLDADATGRISAAASGSVDDATGGFARSDWDTVGYFYFENTTSSAITGSVTFNVSWFANIFTATANEEAYATAGVYIEDYDENIVFSNFIELDSLIDGPGDFSTTDTFSFTLDLTLAADDFEEYFLNVDAFGFADDAQGVPEPSGLFLTGLVLMAVVRKRKVSKA